MDNPSTDAPRPGKEKDMSPTRSQDEVTEKELRNAQRRFVTKSKSRAILILVFVILLLLVVGALALDFLIKAG
jgi:hypothetical protein